MGRYLKVPENHGSGVELGGERRRPMGAIPPVSLLNGVRERIRLEHYSIRTERAQCDRIRRLVIFRGKARQSALGGSGLRRCSIQIELVWPQMAADKIAERPIPHSGKGSNGT